MSQTSSDTVTATISTGSGTTTQQVTLSSPTPIQGTFVATSPAGTIGDNTIVTYNWDPATQLTNFLGSLADGEGANIVVVGDSATLGFGSASSGFRGLSYVAELTQALNSDGVSAQSDNFLGQGNENGDDSDQRVVLLNGATYSGSYDAGGQAVSLDGTGQTISFTLDTPKNYNKITVSYIDQGSGAVNVSVGGTLVGTLQFGNTGNTLSQSISIPLGMVGNVTVTAATDVQSYIQGVSLTNTTANQVQVFNAGIGGWGAGSADTSYYDGNNVMGSTHGVGQVAGTTALNPKLALVDLGLNDITGFTNNGTEVPTSTIAANIEQICATYKSIGCDVIIVIPHPINDPNYETAITALRSDLEQYSTSNNVPIIDLSATYNDDYAALNAAGLMSDSVHPDATLYADFGSQIATLLSTAIKTLTAISAPCFRSGTKLLTKYGYVAVETLEIGDWMITVQNKDNLAPSYNQIVWMGYRHLDITKHYWPLTVLPVRVRHGAFGLNIPKNDLWLSPQHAVYIEGVLIPIIALANGSTIVQENVDKISYWHVELENHDVIIAEGLPVETFLDCNTREGFANCEPVTKLHPTFEILDWSDACAPMHFDGKIVDSIRLLLNTNAKLMGWKITEDADLHITVDGCRIDATSVVVNQYLFHLPPESKNIYLVSRTHRPADNLDNDYRHLGVGVSDLVIDDKNFDISKLKKGWYLMEGTGLNVWRWTNGKGMLPNGAKKIYVTIQAKGNYCISDVAEPLNEYVQINLFE
jgi:hypothetical protein